MYNCEKCIHEELCDQPGRQLWGHLTKETDCSDFKDSTNFVEVVRCKDCKHLGFKGLCDGVCNKKMVGIIKPDDFCSHGERRDNEND